MTFWKRLFSRREKSDILVAFELHSPEQILAALDAGIDPQAPIRGKSQINWLTEMYSRSDNFPKCLRVLLDRGAVLDDPVVAPVLLNDGNALSAAIRADPSLLNHRTTMVSAFTPLVGASLLHVAAEYGNADVAQVTIAPHQFYGCSCKPAQRLTSRFEGSLGARASNGRQLFSM